MGNSTSTTGSDARGMNANFLKDSAYIILIVAALLLLVIVIVYVIHIIMKSTKEVTLVVSKPVRLDGSIVTTPGSKIVSTNNGQEFTYAFWIYVSDQYESTSGPKKVFVRGDTAGIVCPKVVMGSTTNSMTVAIATNKVTDANKDDVDMNAYLKVKVDYVPLQRWVHIAFAVQDAILTLYMDGEIYSVSSVRDVRASSTDTEAAIPKGTSGDVHVGDANYKVKGFLSELRFYNYFLAQPDVMGIYKRGPSGGNVLSDWLGITEYGIRNPFYKISEAATAN